MILPVSGYESWHSRPTLLLADSAHVIKVENPAAEDICPERNCSLSRGGKAATWSRRARTTCPSHVPLRNKLGITLNLVSEACVFRRPCENVRCIGGKSTAVGTLDRLGVGYGWLHEVNPRSVYCSIRFWAVKSRFSPAKATERSFRLKANDVHVRRTAGPADSRWNSHGRSLCSNVWRYRCNGGHPPAQRSRCRPAHRRIMLGALTMMVSVEPFDLLTLWMSQRTGQTLRASSFGVYPTKDGFIAFAC